MGLHCAIDLHGDNGYYGIMNETGKRIYEKRLPNKLPVILEALEPFKKDLNDGVVVESTFNWNCLVDGLNENGYISFNN